MGSDDLFAQTVLSTTGGAVGGVVQRADVELRVGTTLGNYQLERLLGEGSMGKVFQARHARLGRQVALKVLKPEHARDSGFVQRFFQEARTVNQINHEHIVEIFDFVDEGEGGHVYCVMELLRGQSLASLAQEEKLTLARIQRIAVQVCAALGAAHQVGVVHRDVKPDNLFIIHRAGQPDFVKVLDFGVAKLLTSEGNTTGTMDGTIIGTPAYMAPEQAAGLPVDARADIYAVGNMLYELLSGRPPFQAPAFGQLVVQIITQPPPPLPPFLPSGEPLPPQLNALVMRCLAKEPEARPQSLAEVTTALLLLPAPVSVPEAPAPVVDLSERPTKRMLVPLPWRPRVALAAGGAALALVAGVLAWAGLRPERAPAASSEPVALAPAAPSAPRGPVTLTVRSFPEGAQVLRADTGEVLGVTPLIRQLPGGVEPIGLRVELAGYVPLERVVKLDTHAVLEVPLAKAQTAPRQVSGSTRPAARKGGGRDAVIDPFATP
ncbi:serine/threonine protein kinase [Pyxidicoccus fallax]|uniref:Protein kinase n=1 Tax=Pyxidicoccus fallax TaxID=394095 RepID=A0A848LF12_9BACT|nr:serine/threonine-protein kinase [Pyxidicoccus fallax]NMO17096.1 protein kinase [Pyxidicoccus fallax]NPC78839.1 serine/threonine protein kinase [Pyxidicoccus fallax]